VRQKKPAGKPVWTKNTFFWIAGVLILLALVGLPFLGGDKAIRDPGQKTEKIPLFLLYVVAAIVMAVNGVLSHRQTLQQHAEESGETN
jgi:hypothetical protein